MINQVPSTPSAHNIAYSFLGQPTTSPQLENEDFQQMDGDDLEELDLRWSSAQTTESSSQALVAQDGLGGYDWSNDFEVEPVNYALMAISSSNSSSSSDSEVQKCSKCLESFKCLQKNYDTEREKHNKAKLEIRGYEIALESLEARILGHEKNELAWGERYEFQNYDLKCREIKINNLNLELEKMSTHDKNGLGFGTQMDDLSNKSETDSENSLTVFEVRSSDEESTLENNRFIKANEYHVVPPPITGNPLTPRADISFARLNEDEVIIEDWTSDDEDDVCAVQTVSSVKPNVTQAVRSQADKSGQTSQKQGIGFKKVNKIKACFVCKSTGHLIKDCDFYDQKSPEPRVKNVVNTGKREVKPVWDYGKRVNHQNFSKNLKYPHAKRTFNPSAVLTRAGLVNTDRSNVSTARSISTVRPVSTARPLASKIAQSNSVIRPNHPRLDIVRPKASNSPIKRSYFTQPVYRPKDLKPDVKTFGVNNMTTVGTRAVVSKGKVENVLKKAKWGNPEILLQDHAVVDSGCSSHMTGNKAYLSDYEDFNGGFMAFGSDPKGDLLTKGFDVTRRSMDLRMDRCSAGQIYSYLVFYRLILIVYKVMHKIFQMSSIGELTFFLGLQVKQQPDGIFISQDKYVAGILKKFDFCSIKTTTTPIESNKPLVNDEDGVEVDVHEYRSMIGSLMYLTASRPDIMFVVCACARYPRDFPFELEAFSDSDYAGASLDRKSTTGGYQFLGRRLISWQRKKQTIVANSTTEAEYVATAHCCGQKPNESVGFTEVVDFLKGTSLGYALTHNPTIYDSLVKQFWKTVTVRTLANGTQQLIASIDSKEYTITDASVRSAAMDPGEGSAQPAEPHHTPFDLLPSTSLPPHQSPPHSPYQSPPHSPLQSPPHSPPH
ncbi:putative ribonuclease H-like domain-containing protein [Tanacetum coccineum]